MLHKRTILLLLLLEESNQISFITSSFIQLFLPGGSVSDDQIVQLESRQSFSIDHMSPIANRVVSIFVCNTGTRGVGKDVKLSHISTVVNRSRK